MTDSIEININGRPYRVARGVTVAAAILQAGITSFFHSPGGEPRAPLCGMGVCYGCMVTIDGEKGVLACQTMCRKGMEVVTE